MWDLLVRCLDPGEAVAEGCDALCVQLDSAVELVQLNALEWFSQISQFVQLLMQLGGCVSSRPLLPLNCVAQGV